MFASKGDNAHRLTSTIVLGRVQEVESDMCRKCRNVDMHAIVTITIKNRSCRDSKRGN